MLQQLHFLLFRTAAAWAGCTFLKPQYPIGGANLQYAIANLLTDELIDGHTVLPSIRILLLSVLRRA